ncbi:TPA: non-hydrolyzing UDP-N-acetylglucosamine 2-epimerase [Clostridioides difficile]
MSVFGTRPEAVKMAPLIKALEKDERIQSIVCVTAQHREMLDQVLDVFSLKPDYDLNIMTQSQTLEGITTKVIKGISEVLEEVKPDIVLVHGDTSTSFSVALAAFYKKIKIGHVEAGLRTYDKYEPFPEEINRRLTGVLADIHFSPTNISKVNLLKENVCENNIFVTGNTVIDALHLTIDEDYKFNLDVLNEIDYRNKKVITMTAHRRENLGEALENICRAIKRIVKNFEDVEVVYAVHKNPIVRKIVNKYLLKIDRIHLVDPLDIKDMHNLLNRSYLVLTDSGGLQEEVPSLGKPVIVLRNVTERPEGVQAGTLKLSGTDEEEIYNDTYELLVNDNLYKQMAKSKNPFGDGSASERIVKAILYMFDNDIDKPLEYN